MTNCEKKKVGGFTLIEVVVALGILVLMGAFSITTMSTIQKTKMRDFAQTIKSEFELTRNFAKTHGGDIEFSITKTDDGLLVMRTTNIGVDSLTGSETSTTEEKLLEDKNLALFYKRTGQSSPLQLGVDKENGDLVTSTLIMRFSQTDGSIIGPDMLDYIVISNGNKNYKLVIKQATGMMYYDYEISENKIVENEQFTGTKTEVAIPCFIDENGAHADTVTITHRSDGGSVQPNISYDARYVKIGGVYRAADIFDSYTITFTLKDPYTTCWQGEGESSSNVVKTLTWGIS